MGNRIINKQSPSSKVLMKGNEAIAEAAIEAGCRFYAGYPITPQNEIPEYMSERMPDVNGIFIQAESEIAAINMVYGAAAAGVRAMTSSSSPGISLKQEGLSFLAGAELPALIVNIQRGGPGLGNISGSQADYFQAVKGGGHGDYRLLVYAPHNVQEMWDLTMLAFDKADQYRNPVLILADGILGQMMEPFTPNPHIMPALPEKTWALTGCLNRKPNVIKTLFMGDNELENHNLKMQAKYDMMKKEETRSESIYTEDADVVVAAFGSAARIAYSAVTALRREGYKVGLFRPITLFPYPDEALTTLVSGGRKKVLVVELNSGQMIEDVRLAINGQADVLFYGRPGGAMIKPNEIYDKIKAIY
ncbi:3-methyl-2-oxobutanoate dehydrogenase subunit VorB [Candidatus Magnetominusculus xianensis]|uniref:2-ketoisovalerate ferredoxin oxidoreductase n=1 Tax=Candidatus Magnetominusculus xianensis TaxID=1748249 RepID=A0ABR5SCZ9_9BACT|nr:3-methyl-2-oxobutanoate dehydrogenase subunit VorB [Candidatus Magnetominusculus xianensis]KWT82584.1 2-ketoisovalerate ferredoxin oxidoreductase [Candidatus Magnetominusculus xianensis]MBF0405160.1 3-methyl-2-oxobutanoate dehydrogenase subunit VorB [Nitrospirota bacterium]